MKQVKLVMPEANAITFASYAFEKQIRVMLSWLKAGEFFSFSGDMVTMICIMSDEQAEAFKTSDYFKFATA